MPTSFSSQLQEKLCAASSSHTTPSKLGSKRVNARSQPADVGANPSALVMGLFIGTRRGMGLDYCGGSIGMKGMMCVVPGGGCPIQSHSLKKASLPGKLNQDEKMVFLQSTKQDAVVMNRWWRKNAVDHVLDVVMTDTMSEEEWELTLAQPAANNAECMQLFQERVRSSEFAVTYTGPNGISGQQAWWRKSRLICQECGLPVPKEKGIVCANSAFQRQHWKPCQSAWHADYYGAKNMHVQYPIHKLENEDDGLIDDEDIEEEASRFLHARDEDYLMCLPMGSLSVSNYPETRPGSRPKGGGHLRDDGNSSSHIGLILVSGIVNSARQSTRAEAQHQCERSL
jgi:hypothetical protein